MAGQETELADQLPLTGVVLCCTSLPQDVRTKLADTACQMGAIHSLDLTSDVTHLIVANINTPKYRYVAKERPDIAVLSPAFIEAVREAWMEGGEIDVKALEEQHTLPPFFGLQICFTGFTDQTQRRAMEDKVHGNGASYHGDLTKTVTHLIASKPEGAKYKHARQWNINVVSLKWMEDSLKRGMSLAEDLYGPELPEEQQGLNAFRSAKKPVLGKRARVGEQNAPEASGRRKLRKSASTRFDSQSQDMWQNIAAQEVQVNVTKVDAWSDSSQTLRESDRPQGKDNPVNSRPETPMTHGNSNAVFSGHYIAIYGFDTRPVESLRNHLQSNGATVVDSPQDLEHTSQNEGFRAQCLLVPHKGIATLPPIASETLLVTEWWVERCLYYKRYLDPREDPLSSPLPAGLISGFEELTIATTGFVGAHLRQTAEAVKLLGATYDEAGLSPSSSVLVCDSENVKKEKAIWARRHNIPVVSSAWLWESLKTQRAASFDQYKVDLPACDPADLSADGSAPAPSDARSEAAMRDSVDKVKRSADFLPSKRLSNSRKRHATPSLPLQASRPPEQRRPRPRPFMEQEDDVNDQPAVIDDDSMPVPDGLKQPLKEISPNRSQSRRSRSVENHLLEDGAVGKLLTDEPPGDREGAPLSPPHSPAKDEGGHKPKALADLTSDLANILARQNSSKPDSSEPLKRKHRPLGRNLSTISNHSGSACASPKILPEVPESSADGRIASRQESWSIPESTQLGYDMPEAEAHRKRLSKQMGTSFHDDASSGKRVGSVGTVKDSADIGSRTTMTGGRTKGRRAKA